MISHVPRRTSEFDLAVVGGGALGCALAWEASTRGLRVVLLEQEDFGSGASANSLKIVHGGLRYLQKLDIRRARASAFERSVLLRIAPHLVRPLQCMLPTRRSLLRGRLAMASGLAMNAMVTFDRNRGLRPDRRLPAGGLVSLDTLAAFAPGLNIEGATAGAQWFDAQMADSERLPLAFAKGAEAHGAVLLNHHRVTEFAASQGRITGVVAEDCLGARSLEIPASVVADCRCAWAHGSASPPVFATPPPFIKAVNILLPRTDLQNGLGFPMRDERGNVIPGRMLFATAWNDVTIVGTWYSVDSRGPGSGLAPGELATMLDSVNNSYGGWQFQPRDIRAVHVGFLPAMPESIAADGEPTPMGKPMCEPASAAGGPTGLWYLQTEKWTTVRRLAQSFIDRLTGNGVFSATASNTATLPLPGGEEQGATAAREALRASGLGSRAARRFAAAYGAGVPEVLALRSSRPGGNEVISASEGVLAAEVMFAIECEHARTLGDLLRRTGIGSTGRPARETLESMVHCAAEALDWDAAEQRRQIAAVLRWPQFQCVPESPEVVT